MFFLKLLRYLRGYVLFEARGVFIERFLNLVARDHIPVWEGCKRGEVYTGCVPAGEYRRLRRHAKKTGVRLRVREKRGTPFQKRKLRGRTGVIVGCAIFFAFLFGMSKFIWRIEITGNEEMEDVVILQALETLDITSGTLRSSIDVRDCERKMLMLLPDLSWAALNIDGSALVVDLRESVQPPEMVDPNRPCNIVAKEAGQITAMNVFDGQKLVAVGDTVLPGDIIVSGITQDGRGQSLFRHARAEVFAETLQTLEVSVPLEQITYVETGKTRSRNYLDLFGFEIPLFLPLTPPSPYRVERTEYPLRVFAHEFPVRRLHEEYILMREQPLTLSEEQARQEALLELVNLRRARLGDAEILRESITGRLEGGSFVIRAEYFCRMNIAREQEIYLQEQQATADTRPRGS